MNRYSIALIPGDGIGKEVIPAGLRVLQAAGALTGSFQLDPTPFPWGCEFYLAHGRMMDADGLAQLGGFDAIYLGAVGYPGVPDHISLWGLLLPIRQGFDQYINLRPIRLLEGIAGPLRDKGPADIDFQVVRENSEGEYSGHGGRSHRGRPQEVATQTTVFTRAGVERVIRYAFELGRARGVTEAAPLISATKSNAQQYVSVFWDEVCEEVAAGYPDVPWRSMLVDALAALMVLHPERLSVVVGSNLFGDILTDLGGALQGSLGVPASANLNPERRYPSMFEPVHGSAPDIAGRGLANPLASIWAGAMLLDHLGEREAGARVQRALEHVVAAGQVRTPDLGGQSTTDGVANAVIAALGTAP
ncbi:MAG TPA: tartrate dehydrogenase [Chloroflexia bacterium]|nr:tartrate dehydrogenase [Chloroflexia bacterium]